MCNSVYQLESVYQCSYFCVLLLLFVCFFFVSFCFLFYCCYFLCYVSFIDSEVKLFVRRTSYFFSNCMSSSPITV